MIVGVHGLGRGRRPEHAGDLGVTLFVGFLGEGQVFAIGLRLAGKGFLQILLRLGHGFNPSLEVSVAY